MGKRTRSQIEFGDFQTPTTLASKVAAAIASRGLSPKSIVEPTCGVGSILFSALQQFPEANSALGVEINEEYFRRVDARLAKQRPRQTVELRREDFFLLDWPSVLRAMPEPILIIGNPPWVTASELGAINGKNLPGKSNFQRRSGIEAITGKSNFDIAEWMLIHLLKWASTRTASLGMLVKTAVARKVMLHAWVTGLPLMNAGLYRFDTQRYFGVSVDACLLVCDLVPGQKPACKCDVFDLEKPRELESMIALVDGSLVSNAEAYSRLRHLARDDELELRFRWRSGVKHDCASVMELKRENGLLRNCLGEVVDIEDTYLYPMLKGSGVANGARKVGDRFMIVTQELTGQDTALISTNAPKTWDYLCKHGARLDNRKSRIYQNRPRFSIFGIGDYSFAPWKVAICGLYKKLEFTVVGPYGGKPVVLDDTAYHLSCRSEKHASLLARTLNSEPCREFLASLVFWDAKRPITIDLLHRINLDALAVDLGTENPVPWGSPDSIGGSGEEPPVELFPRHVSRRYQQVSPAHKGG